MKYPEVIHRTTRESYALIPTTGGDFLVISGKPKVQNVLDLQTYQLLDKAELDANYEPADNAAWRVFRDVVRKAA